MTNTKRKKKKQRPIWSKKAVKSYAHNILTNDVVFKTKCAENKDLMKEILDWKSKLRLIEEGIGDVIDGTANVGDDEKLAEKITKLFIHRVVANKKENMDFIRWFYNFFERYNLNRIWDKSILRFIACGYYCPPLTKTVDILLNEEENIVELKLQPETSSLDLKNSWYLIKRELDKLKTSKDKKRRVPRTFYKRLKEQLRIKQLKQDGYYDYAIDKEIGYKNELDILKHMYERDEKMFNNISKNPKKFLSGLRTSRHRLKPFLK